MAKKRKGSSLNDASKMTDKQRQQASSKAAGLVSSPSGLIYYSEKKQYTLPASVYKAATQKKYSGSWQDAVRAQPLSPGQTKPLPIGTPISNPLTSGKIASSKSAQASFLASEKKKSGKTTAKNVKRRER